MSDLPMNKSKCAALFHLLGTRWLTAADSMRLAGVLSLSQRVSVWRSEGVIIVDKWVEANGSRFKAYRRLTK